VPLRLAAPLAIVALAAVLVGGCGGSSSDRGSTSPSAPLGATAKSCDTHAVDAEGLRASGISCSQARQVMYGWQRESSCSSPAGASRTSCLTRSYRCLGTHTARGLAVSCSRAGQSIAFIARRG
jgi:hypothetical protein